MTVALPQSSEPLAVWERLELVVGEDVDSGRYVARIEDFVNEGVIISNPEYLDGRFRIREGIQIRGFVIRRDAVYQFYSRIKNFTIQGKQLFLLTKPANIKRVQRRQFVRIDLVREVELIRIDKFIENMGSDSHQWIKARTYNISGGGLMINCQKELANDDPLLLKSPLFLEVGLPVTIAAVCRREILKDKKIMYGVEFLRSETIHKVLEKQIVACLPESTQFFDLTAQNKLVNYIFSQQVELRKKGLL